MLEENNKTPAYPLSVSVFYGSDFDPSLDPVSFTIPSAAALAAFIKGRDEADGYFGATFLDHGNYRVDAEGQLVEKKAPAQKARPNERFVMWGEDPEKGAKPEKYVFEDEPCAQAFEASVNAFVGWTQMSFVPGPDYRAYRDLEHALEEVDASVAASLRAVVALETDDLGEHDPIFIDTQGRYVQMNWFPGEYVCNTPVDAPAWSERFNARLLETAGVSAAHLSEEERQAWATGPYARFPERAAEDFAEKNASAVEKQRPRAPKP